MSSENYPILLPYEAAGTGPRLRSWLASSSGPNAVLEQSLVRLRNRNRQEYRNNPWIKKAISAHVTNEIGKGITPHSCVDDEVVREAIRTLWKRSHPQLDADGVTNFYGLQSIAVRARSMSGEVFVRRRVRRVDTPGLEVPIQFQLLEGDFCPIHENKRLDSGRYIQQGIEFDRRGQRIAYHFYTHHPGDRNVGRFDGTRTVRVPASQVIHHFIPTRPGQIRGEVITAQSLFPAKEFREYSDTEMVRKKTRAPITGFITRETDSGHQYNPLDGAATKTELDSQGNTIAPPPVDISPGTLLEGNPGEGITLFSGDDNGRGMADYMRWKLLELAAGVDLPYEIMSGDWAGVNDRLVRAILNELHRFIESLQNQFTIPQICSGMWAWWMDWAVFSNRLKISDYADDPIKYRACEWRPHAWPYVHPEQDIKAARLAIAADISSTPAEAAKRGNDYHDTVRENAQYRADREGIYQEFGIEPPEESASPKEESVDETQAA